MFKILGEAATMLWLNQAAAVAGHGPVTPDVAKLMRTARMLGITVNAGVLCWTLWYTGKSFIRSVMMQREKARQSNGFAERIWLVVAQRDTGKGLVPPDLGQPDEDGIYTKHSCAGQLYFRLVKDGQGVDTWEWSIDKLLWIPTAYADSFWYATDSTPSEADKIMIRRLEVEAQLRRREVRRSPVVWQPPALDISMAKHDVMHLELAKLPQEFLCPISMQLMTDPVVSPTGVTYDRQSLQLWIQRNHTDPATGQPLDMDQLYPNLSLRDMIQKWLVQPDAITALIDEDS